MHAAEADLKCPVGRCFPFGRWLLQVSACVSVPVKLLRHVKGMTPLHLQLMQATGADLWCPGGQCFPSGL